MSKYILVTGGLGFIGSHITVELIKSGYNVIIVDNLSNSSQEVFDEIIDITNRNFTSYSLKLYIIDLLDKHTLYDLFSKYSFTTIIHCAGLKSVNESIKQPLKYYQDNLTMTFNLLDLMEKYNVERFIFSSSATVYGSPKSVNTVFKEDDVVGQNITNPYGQTKYMQEQIIRDFAITQPDKCFVILRYFNPVGAHPSGLIGENPGGRPNNLMPYILRVAANNSGLGFNVSNEDKENYKQLTIYGTNYNTRDGTCIRDFIHVDDLAKAHVSSVEFEFLDKNVETFNIGTGNGISVMELVTAFQGENDVLINITNGEIREGDPSVVICDVSKAREILGWEAELKIGDMVKDAWNFMKSSLNEI